MKRILYTDYSSGFGGSSTVLYDFLKNLDRSTYEPIVVVTRDGQNFDKTRALGIEVINTKITVIGMAPYRGMSTMGSLILDLILHLIPNVLKLLVIIKEKKNYVSEINVSIYNVYGRQNAYSIAFEQNETNPSQLDAVQTALFRQVPSISWNFKFR